MREKDDRIADHADLLSLLHILAFDDVAVGFEVSVEAVNELASDVMLDDHDVDVIAAVLSKDDHPPGGSSVDGLAQTAARRLEPILG